MPQKKKMPGVNILAAGGRASGAEKNGAEEAICHAGLTPRQYEILRLLRTTLVRKEIAARLNITVRGVAEHARMIYARFGVRSRVELLRLLGFRNGE